MDSRQVYRISPGHIALGILIGALLPVAGIFQISLLMPTLMAGGIFAVYLRARGGWAPVVALALAALAASAWLLGATLTLILMVAALSPALVVMQGVSRKAPFFEQMRVGVIAFVAGLLAAMLIAYFSFGGGMIARFVGLLRSEYDLMPDAALQPLVDWTNTLLPAGMTQGGQAVTVAYFREQLSGILDLLQETYAQMLPGTLLSGALLSGIISVFWGNWTMARRGMATNESFVGMSGWFMPARLSVGAVALWIAGLIMMSANVDNGTTVYMTISQTVGAAFAVQALCAMNRRMLRAGRTQGRRRTLVTLLAVAGLLLRGLGAALAYIGVASALFGSHGAIRQWTRNRQDEPSDHDDPDE